MEKKDIEIDEDYEIFLDEKTKEKMLNDYFGDEDLK